MKISEAIEKANAEKRGITRKSWLPNKNAPYLIVTDTSARVIYISGDNSSQRWIPKADDLVAKDWMVFG